MRPANWSRSTRPSCSRSREKHPFVYAHIRYEARCRDLNGQIVPLVREQFWQRSRERPALFQGAWRWTPAGEGSG